MSSRSPFAFLLLSAAMVLLVASSRAGAATPLETAQVTAVFFDRVIALAAEHCQQPALRSAAGTFRRNLAPELEAGKHLGSRLADARGQDFEQFILQGARDFIEQVRRSRGEGATCAALAEDLSPKAAWSIDDFLRMEYDGMVRSVGNQQGYPCEMLRIRSDLAVDRFLASDLDFSEEKMVNRALMAREVRTVIGLIQNCERAQAHAAEYRVTRLEDYATPKQALELIDRSLHAFGPDRQAQLAAALETLKRRRQAGPR